MLIDPKSERVVLGGYTRFLVGYLYTLVLLSGSVRRHVEGEWKLGPVDVRHWGSGASKYRIAHYLRPKWHPIPCIVHRAIWGIGCHVGCRDRYTRCIAHCQEHSVGPDLHTLSQVSKCANLVIFTFSFDFCLQSSWRLL